jgi:hypothetical protein
MSRDLGVIGHHAAFAGLRADNRNRIARILYADQRYDWIR